ncbi:MAG: hypothetical protein GF331_02025 [Chitinivibrionales bacterium]|nr:hypothetical protein [Chitinivibrionales bacterium]
MKTDRFESDAYLADHLVDTTGAMETSHATARPPLTKGPTADHQPLSDAPSMLDARLHPRTVAHEPQRSAQTASILPEFEERLRETRLPSCTSAMPCYIGAKVAMWVVPWLIGGTPAKGMSQVVVLTLFQVYGVSTLVRWRRESRKMALHESIITMARWMDVCSTPLNSIRPIDKEYVHKVDLDQVVISDVHSADEYAFEIPELRPYPVFYAHACPNLKCPVCFDHPLDHLPLMTLFEVGRQLGIAMMHLYYGIPLKGMCGIARELSFEFVEFAELDMPLTIFAIDKKEYTPGERVHERTWEYYLVQRNMVCGKGVGCVAFLRQPIYKRMRTGSRARKLEAAARQTSDGPIVTNVDVIHMYSRGNGYKKFGARQRQEFAIEE